MEAIIGVKKFLLEKLHSPFAGLPGKVRAELYPLPENPNEIPKEALNPCFWEIPEGYYAIVTEKAY